MVIVRRSIAAAKAMTAAKTMRVVDAITTTRFPIPERPMADAFAKPRLSR
jgi:hypothetical protein